MFYQRKGFWKEFKKGYEGNRMKDAEISLLNKETGELVIEPLEKAEIWGMNSKLCEPLQKIMDDICLNVMKGSKNAGRNRMRTELGIFEISQIATEKRVRAWFKYSKLKTWISILIKEEWKGREWTWVSGIQRWLKSYIKDNNMKDVCIKDKKDLNMKSILEGLYKSRAKGKDRTKVSAWASELGLTGESLWINVGMMYPGLSKGLLEIGRIRMGMILFGPELAKAEYLNARYRIRCPICEMKVIEDLKQIVFICSGYNKAREEHIKTIFLSWDELIESPTDQSRVISILLGGEFEMIQYLTIIEKSNERYERYEAISRVIRMAKFLQEIIPLRTKILMTKLKKRIRPPS